MSVLSSPSSSYVIEMPRYTASRLHVRSYPQEDDFMPDSCCGCFGGRNVTDWTIPIFSSNLFLGTIGLITGSVFLGLSKGDLASWIVVGVSTLVVGISVLAIWRIKRFKPVKTEEEIVLGEVQNVEMLKEIQQKRTALLELQARHLDEQWRINKERALLLKKQADSLVRLDQQNQIYQVSNEERKLFKKQFVDEVDKLTSILQQAAKSLEEKTVRLNQTQDKLRDITQKSEGLNKALQELSQQSLQSVRGEVKDLTLGNKELNQQLEKIAEIGKNLPKQSSKTLQTTLEQVEEQVKLLADYYEKVKKEKEQEENHLLILQQVQEKVRESTNKISEGNVELKDNSQTMKQLVEKINLAKTEVIKTNPLPA